VPARPSGADSGGGAGRDSAAAWADAADDTDPAGVARVVGVGATGAGADAGGWAGAGWDGWDGWAGAGWDGWAPGGGGWVHGQAGSLGVARGAAADAPDADCFSHHGS
jgi:hypothetical protein